MLLNSGRPSSKVRDFNIQNPEDAAKIILSHCTSENLKQNGRKLSQLLRKNLQETAEKETQVRPSQDTKQTQTETSLKITQILKDISSLNTRDISYLVSQIFSNQLEDIKVKLIFQLYQTSLSKGEQENVYYVFGKLLNVALKDSTADKDLISPSLVTMDDIMNSTKAEAYSKIDSRLRNFIDGITELQDQSANKVNFKYNAVENLLKARDNNFVSKTGLKEGLATFMASGKNKLASNLMSKQGAKGGISKIVKLVNASEIIWEFKAPHYVTAFGSFDNIQTSTPLETLPPKFFKILDIPILVDIYHFWYHFWLIYTTIGTTYHFWYKLCIPILVYIYQNWYTLNITKFLIWNNSS